jgi:hypothetical protein
LRDGFVHSDEVLRRIFLFGTDSSNPQPFLEKKREIHDPSNDA